MSISVLMPNSSSLYEIDETRVERLLSGDKKYATYMGLWDRFKDYFRSEKKAEAIERLYDFIHSDDISLQEENKNNDPFPKTIWFFEKLKSLTNDNNKESFHTEINPYEGIDFYIGSHKVKSLDNCIASYALYEFNHHSDMKNIISDNINNLPPSQCDPLSQLVIDMERQDGAALEYKKLSNQTEESKKVVVEHTNAFYKTLTPEQQKKVLEVGTQACFANFQKILLKAPILLGQHLFLAGRMSTRTVMYHNEGSSDITVIQSSYRKHDKNHHNILFADTMQELYPEMQLDLAFTISSDGHTECLVAHVSDEIRDPAYSLTELQASINAKNS